MLRVFKKKKKQQSETPVSFLVIELNPDTRTAAKQSPFSGQGGKRRMDSSYCLDPQGQGALQMQVVTPGFIDLWMEQ